MFYDAKIPDQIRGYELSAGTQLLRNQYTIEKTLMEEGFGISYLARDSLDRQVVIKECFIDALCLRHGRSVKARSESQTRQFESVIENFLNEARRLARLSHPSIVGVHQVFEENNTTYMVLDFIDGVDFLTLLETCPEKLNRRVLEKALLDTLDALEYVHDLQILHRDISPDNIMLDSAGRLKIIDFGAARDNCLRKDRALSALLAVKDGYSPHEFYLDESEQRTSSDLYSVAATFYHLITGVAPPDSQKRIAAIASEKSDPYQPLVERDLGYDRKFMESIDKCMNISQPDRIPTAGEWLEFLVAGDTRQPNEAHAISRSEDTLAASIAELVDTTNEVVQRVGKSPHRAKQQASHDQNSVMEPLQKQLVDLFGNPIDDVEAWMKEQEELVAEGEGLAGSKGGRTAEDEHRSVMCGSVRALFSQMFQSSASNSSVRAL